MTYRFGYAMIPSPPPSPEGRGIRKNVSPEGRGIRKSVSPEGRGSRERISKIWISGYLLLLLLPWMLIWSRAAADVIVTTLAVLFLFHSFRVKDFSWTNDNFIRASLLAWLWLVLVVSPLAYYPQASFLNALVWVRYVLFYAAVRHFILVERKPILFMAQMLAVMLVFCALDSLWQYVTGMSLTSHPIDISGRLTGPMDNVKVGIFMAKLLLPVSGVLLFFSAKHSNKTVIIVMAFMLFCYAMIMVSGERTAFAVFSISIFIAVILLAWTNKKLRHICAVFFMLATISAGVLFYTQNWIQQRVGFTVYTFSNFKDSAYGQLFRIGYELGKEHPASGVGLKGFREQCLDYLARGEEVVACNLHPHNPYIEWFAEAGMVGVLLFCLMVAMLLLEAAKFFITESDSRKIIPAAAMTTGIMNFFPFAGTQSFFSNWPAMLLWLSIALAFSAHNLFRSDHHHIASHI